MEAKIEKTYLIPASESLQEIRTVIANEIRQQFLDQRRETGHEKLFYVAQVAARLGKAHKTVKNMVLSGVIRSTKNGLIPESAIEDFLKGV